MMKKIFWVLLALLLCLTACGSEEPVETTAPPPVEVQVPYEAPTEVLPYAHVSLTVQSMWLREDPQARVLLEAAELFRQQTGAEVMIRWADEAGVAPETAQGIDIFQLREADFAAMPKEFAMDLTEMAEMANYDAVSHETLRQQIIAQCGYLGAVAQVPYLGGIYYNREVFAQCGIEGIPTDWDSFLSLCSVLREQDWQPLTLDQENALRAMELHLRRTIGSYEIQRLMAKGNRWDTNMPAITALEQVMLFVAEGNMASATPADTVESLNKMALSNAVMTVCTNADCAAMEERTLIDLDWGVFPYPGKTESGTWMSADVLMIHRDSPNGQAAFDFLMLLVRGEFDQLCADISGGIPADPNNASPVFGAMEAIQTAQPEVLDCFGSKQMETALRLWGGRYDNAGRYASLLELSK